jgi:hypothetical protein
MSHSSSRAEVLPLRFSSPVAKVPLLDVARGNQPLREEFLEAIAKVLDSGRPFVEEELVSSHVCSKEHIRQAVIIYIADGNTAAVVEVPVSEDVKILAVPDIVSEVNPSIIQAGKKGIALRISATTE